MTERAYYHDTYCFVMVGKVVSLEERKEDGNTDCTLDRTIFHPQGGGQPSDRGTVGPYEVLELRTDHESNTIVHTLNTRNESTLLVDDEVLLKVDEPRRRYHARLHSAGHLLDVAVRRLDLPLRPGKGYHHPTGAYVAYEGDIPADDRQDTIGKLSTVIKEIIETTPEDDCVTSKIDAEGTRTVRLVQEDLDCLCGGTHVEHVSQIGAVEITKISRKQKKTRIGYSVEPTDE